MGIMSKSDYNRLWYQANRMYKKTYSRMQKRGWVWGCEAIVDDRKSQVKKGRWIDERTGSIYHGIALKLAAEE